MRVWSFTDCVLVTLNVDDDAEFTPLTLRNTAISKPVSSTLNITTLIHIANSDFAG